MKKNLIVLQEGAKDCGAASLLSIIHYFSMKSYSHRHKLNKLRKEL